MNRDVSSLLERVPCFRGQDTVVTPLSGGLTNESFRIDVGGESYVLRVLSPGTEHLGIIRAHEDVCSRRAAEIGIGPEVVHYGAKDSILVLRFVEGETLTAHTAGAPERLARLADAIRRVHEGPTFPGTFCPFRTVRAYSRVAVEHGVVLPGSLFTALEILGRIETALAGRRRAVPCHNDLLAGNFIDDGRRIWVIDWEYGGMGDPFFDLGNFCVNQELDDPEDRRFLELYLGEFRDADLAHLKLMRLVSDLREAAWGIVQSGVSTFDFDYLAYGEKHLARFLRGASGENLESWIEAVSA